MKRILQVISAGYPGGGTNHVLQICTGLKSSFELCLISQTDSYLLHEARQAGILATGMEFFSSRCDVRIPLRLRQAIEDLDPHLVHVHGGRAGLFHALARTGRPTVYSVHGFHFVQKSAAVRWLAVRGERLAVRRADRVIFESEHDRSLARTYGILPRDKSCVVIHNGIPRRAAPAVPTGVPRVIGFIGRMEQQKDPMLFLDVMECLPGREAVMVGGGEMEADVARAVQARGLAGRVRMLGTLSHQKTLELLPTLAVIVMTSRWEGLPLLPLDAMSAGVAVVATNVGGLPEIIENGTSGMLIDGRSPRRIAEAVIRVTEDAQLRGAMLAEARTRVAARFSEAQMLAAIGNVYARLL